MGPAGKSPLGSAVRAPGLGGWAKGKAGRRPGGGGHAPPRHPPRALRLQPSVQGCRLMKRAAFPPVFFFPGEGVRAKHAWRSSAGAAWGEGPSKSPQTQPSDPVKPAGGRYPSSSPPTSAGPISGTAGGKDWLLPLWPLWEVGSSLLHGATKTPVTLPSAPGPSLPCPMVKRQRSLFCVDEKPLGSHPGLPS